MKHIRTCQYQLSVQDFTDKKCPRSSNPLLFITTDYQLTEIDCIFESLGKITKKEGFNLCVLGQDVTVKIWIHYFICDTEGNNKWLGQYPGNRDGVQRLYRDCKCTYDD